MTVSENRAARSPRYRRKPRAPWGFIFLINGFLLAVLALAMLVPAAADLASGSPDWKVFVGSAAVTAFIGVALILGFRYASPEIAGRYGYVLTVSAWVFVGAFGALPFVFSSLKIGYVDAFFETMSGLTTTGSTVLTGLDHMPAGILLWRSLLQWFGGVGIVVMAIAMLPVLRIGGMQLFRTESSDISGKPYARLYQLVNVTLLVYLALSAACALALWGAGMPAFDALNHAMATLATGGYSTKDSSIGFYNSAAIEAVEIVFMTAGALPLVFYAAVIIDGRRAMQREGQVVPFLAVLLACIAIVTAWNWQANGQPILTALRVSAFNVTSILTDTGFATADFGTWGGFAVGFFFLLYFIGGCAGSTAGAIKLFRWRILFIMTRLHLHRIITPQVVAVPKYLNQSLDEDTISSVRTFFFAYILTFIALSLVLAALGLDMLTGASAVAQAMANAGPGLGDIVGPAGNFSTLPDAAKLILVLAMLLGRLELFTLYIMLIPRFWRW